MNKNLNSHFQDASPAAIHTSISGSYADLLERNTSGDDEAKRKMHVKTALAAARAVTAIEAKTDAHVSTPEDSKNLDDVLMPYLDSQFGASVDAKDHSIFTKLTTRHERRFTEDMRALNILDPDDITRVTEYGPQIVDFVAKIQHNGFAYQTSKGVYFDVEAFENANNNYARLEPWNRHDEALQADGEGAITGKDHGKRDTEKRSQADFALWKFSKPGEPSWPSPWGEGRPGWHIECSAMASDTLGSQIDIHSGGIDLAFPHHDNELAQSEAYWCDASRQHQHQWVNYFMHMGHLSIAGAKMSKSLKNFTTIRDALNRRDWTSRGLRIVLLLGGWRESIEITDDLVKAGSAWEDKVNNFFINAKDILGPDPVKTFGDAKEGVAPPTLKDLDAALEETFEVAQMKTYTALCDSFNTAAVMGLISELITVYNADESEVPRSTTWDIVRWITSMVNIFGLNGTAGPRDRSVGWSGLDVPEAARPTLEALSNLRDQLRIKARSPEGISLMDVKSIVNNSRLNFDVTAHPQEFTEMLQTFWVSAEGQQDDPKLSRNILTVCDQVRDVDLWQRGIYLEDRDGGKPALIRLVTREMQAARDEKEEKERQKQKAKAEREAEAAAKAEKGKLSHLEMFKTDEYGEWDEEGLPTKDKDGEGVAKSKAKKLRKDWERQKKAHEAWMKANA